ncbi:serine hydrolase [Limibaculum sp. FT325]|uniref:D-alanyl-D-alanine carboxypeptidase family protein n=1 Tax=Thermohalobaculum sediminis TaxID=2939436 RepID=UPI0020BDEDCD|nr:D-alanyl-D-alanine carboxypeptidase family protein [Limibaculum sediminis]MCL5777910.1 serine hydrolase [Limibaculum sediminis]
MRLLGRGIILVALCTVVAVVSVPAKAAPYAAIVMDMRDGSVLHADNADRVQHPASLTKMMTLYLAFEAVESGQLGLDQSVRVSRNAARQPPSKLYLKEGSRVTIRSLIRAAAIKSANDAAMVLAEAIGGSEAGFAKLMTDKARALGMRNTTFRNPHGLTEKGHVTTARDMAILARHLYFDFPAYYNVFSKRSDIAAGKRIWTTNRLLGSYRGAEGMKTGYTRAAGYNLVAVAARGSERVIAVVLGGRSSRARNDKVAELLDLGFRKAPTRVAIVRPQAAAVQTRVAEAPIPEPKPELAPTGLAALSEAFSSEAVAATRPSAPVVTAGGRGTRHAPVRAALPRIKPGSGGTRIALVEPKPMPVARPDWSVTLGEYRDQAEAVAIATSVSLADIAGLDGAAPRIEEVNGARGKLYRVEVTGLDPRAAESTCSTLRAHGTACSAISPQD